MNPLAWADAGIILGIIAWGIRDYLRGGPGLWRLADPTPTEEELIREALQAELDAMERQHDFELWEASL